MALELPGWLVTAFNLVGLPWPGIDEDQLRAWATSVRGFADEMGNSSTRTHGVVSGLAQSSQSSVTSALLTTWEQHNRLVADLHGPLDDFAEALDVAADVVVAQKWAVIGAATALAGEFAATQIGAFFTFGADEAAVPEEIISTRELVRIALEYLEQELIGKLLGLAVQEVTDHVSRFAGELLGGGVSVVTEVGALKMSYSAVRGAASAIRGQSTQTEETGEAAYAENASRDMEDDSEGGDDDGDGGGWAAVLQAVEQGLLDVAQVIFKSISEAIAKIQSDTASVLSRFTTELEDTDKSLASDVPADSGQGPGVDPAAGAAPAGGGEALPAAGQPDLDEASNTPGASDERAARVGGGDPVDVATGAVMLAETDVRLPGALPLVLERSHVSSWRAGRWFGRSWLSSFDQRLLITADKIVGTFAGGRILTWRSPGGPAATQLLPVTGPLWPLRRNPDGSYQVTDPQRGLTWRFEHRAGYPVEAADAQELPLVSLRDRVGDEIVFNYDAAGRPVSVVHSGGYRVQVTTAADGHVTGLTLAGRQSQDDIALVSYTYDTSGNLSGIVNSAGRPLRLGYDRAGRLTSWTDRNGHYYRYTYDDQGRCVRGEGPGGALSGTFSYQPGITRWTDSTGAVTEYEITGSGEVGAITDPLGNVTRWEHDSRGRLSTEIDAIGRVTRFAYDDRGNLIAITSPDGSQLVTEYDESCQPVHVTHSDGRSWRYERGADGQVTSIVNPLGAVLRFGYDERGRLASTTDPLGAVTSYRCDLAGLPVERTDALGATTVTRRDAFGRITEIVDAMGGSTRHDWSPAGRLLRTRYPDGATEQWDYDQEGNVLRIVGPTGAATSFSYGPFDKPVSRTDPDGSVYRFAYNDALRLTTVTGPTGLAWRYEYDAAGRLVAETDFDGVRVDYRLDGAGQLVARSTPAGPVEFTRDPLGRLIERQVNGRVTRFAYGIAGQLRRAEGPDAVLEYTFDALGQTISESVNGHTLTNAYDAAGRRVERVTSSGVVTRWAYDAVGQHTAMSGTAGTLAFGYDAAGRETGRLLGPGAAVHRSYDAAGRLRTEGIWAYPDGDAAVTGTAGPRVQVQARDYSYLPDGIPAEIQDALRGTRRFELDTAGRITRVQAASWQADYAYDALGNLTETADPAMPEDSTGAREFHGTRIVRAGRTVYEYDEAGRLVRRTRRTLSGQTRTWRFSWAAEGQLTRTALPAGDSWRYAYDPLGRRIGKTHHAADDAVLETVRFDWDGPRLSEETTVDPDGQATVRSWDYQPGGFTPVAQTRRSWAGDAPQPEIDAEFHAIVTDLVGTPTELLTPEGELAWYTTVSVWGSTIRAPGSTADCPLRFPGQYHDEESGLDYNLYRYYDPGLGAYLSPDPLGLAPSSNNTAYVDNPLVRYDPLGLFSCPVQVQQELGQFRSSTNMKSVAEEDAEAARITAAGRKTVPSGTLNTVGKMEFDGGRDPVYGMNGRLADRSESYPGKGQGITRTSYEDHAEGDMVYQATQRGYSGGNAAIYTDRATCNFCRNSMSGYARALNLDTITAYGPNGLIGIWDQTGKIG